RRQLARIAQRPLTESTPVTTSGGYHRHPTWTPDGRLLYPEYLRGESPVLLLDSRDGKPPRRIIFKSPFGSYSVTRDGKALVFAAYDEVDRFRSYYDLYRVDLATRKV